MGNVESGLLHEFLNRAVQMAAAGHPLPCPGQAVLPALETALDEIFSDFELKARLIDVRINFGGDDPMGSPSPHVWRTASTRHTPNTHELTPSSTTNGRPLIPASSVRVRGLDFEDRW